MAVVVSAIRSEVLARFGSNKRSLDKCDTAYAHQPVELGQATSTPSGTSRRRLERLGAGERPNEKASSHSTSSPAWTAIPIKVDGASALRSYLTASSPIRARFDSAQARAIRFDLETEREIYVLLEDDPIFQRVQFERWLVAQ